MTDVIDPTSVETEDRFRICDSDSPYDGAEGRVVAVFTDRLVLELDEASPVAHVLTFDLEQLERA